MPMLATMQTVAHDMHTHERYVYERHAHERSTHEGNAYERRIHESNAYESHTYRHTMRGTLSCHAKLCLWLWSMLRVELATF
jgi:hypothetical protein